MEGSLARKYDDSRSGAERQPPSTGSKNLQVVGPRGAMRWLDVRLGPIQITSVVGAMLGFVAGAFYLGFHSGRTVGFDMARSSSAVDVAKLPIPESMQNGESKDPEPSAQPIYDRLNEKAGFGAVDSQESESEPLVNKAKDPKSTDPLALENAKPSNLDSKPLNTVKAKSDASVPSREDIAGAFDDVSSQKEAKPNSLDKSEVIPEAPPQGEVRVLGEGSESKKTLGSILDERIKEVRGDDQANAAKSLPAAQKGKAVVAVSPDTLKPETVAKKVEEAPATQPKVVAKTESQDTVRGVLPAGWFAQVAAPKRIGEAQEVAKRLKSSGFKVLIENAHVRGEDYFRVVVGPEESKVQADRLVQQLKRESYLSGEPFVRRNR